MLKKYKVKLLNKSKISKEISPNAERQHISTPFIIEELGLSGNAVIIENEYTLEETKAIIKEKIIAHLAKLAKQIEYEVTIE